MLRAATLGIIDFAQFDPSDNWWWRRLHLILDELGRQNQQEALTARQRHWLAHVSNPRLDDDSWENTRQHAREALNGLMQGYFPWRAKEIGEEGTKTARDHAVEQFHEMYGKPGEPKYEHMVAELSAYFARGKLSLRQKELERKQRRERAALAG